jgi:hypothetical protein
MRYIKGTIYHGLYIKPFPKLCLNTYNDVDWTGYPDDRRSSLLYNQFEPSIPASLYNLQVYLNLY